MCPTNFGPALTEKQAAGAPCLVLIAANWCSRAQIVNNNAMSYCGGLECCSGLKWEM